VNEGAPQHLVNIEFDEAQDTRISEIKVLGLDQAIATPYTARGAKAVNSQLVEEFFKETNHSSGRCPPRDRKRDSSATIQRTVELIVRLSAMPEYTFPARESQRTN